MKDQNGERLCTISTKKAEWYIHKNLAHWVQSPNIPSSNNTNTTTNNKTKKNATIQLNFEPKGRSNRCGDSSSVYVTTDKLNICVSCGNSEQHMRHYIVPYAYRSLLPKQYKSHMSHDIVIVCPTCNVDCQRQCQYRMRRLEETARQQQQNEQQRRRISNKGQTQDTGGGRTITTNRKFEHDPYLYKVRSCALALLRWKHKLPLDKIQEYDDIVRSYLHNTNTEEELTSTELQEAIDVDYRVENTNYIPGPELIVQMLGKDEIKIANFIRGWRIHFIDTVRPRYMPMGWSIDNPVTSGS